MDKNRGFQNFIWNLIGTTVNAFMSFVYQVAVARINGLDATGVFTVCYSFSMLMYTFANLGGRVFEVTDGDGDDNTYYTLKWISAALSLLFTLMFAWVSGYERSKIILVVLLVLVRIVESLSDTIYAILQKQERLDLVGISYVIKNIVAIFVFVVTDLLTGSMILSVFATLLVTVVVYLTFDRSASASFCRLRINTSREELRVLSSRMYGFIIYNLLIMVIANMPKLIADVTYTDGQMGYFGILMMIPTVMLLIGQVIIQQYLTKLASLYRERNYGEIVKNVSRIFGGISGLTLMCCGLAYFLGAPVLNMVYGLNFEAYKIAMLLLVVAGMFNVLSAVLSAVLTIMEKSRQQMYLYLLISGLEFGILSLGLSSESFAYSFLLYTVVMVIQFAVFQLFFWHVCRSVSEPS